MLSRIAVVGASLAGLSAARALRSAGFSGRLVVIGAERHRPYDRPPLSKEFLAGKQTAEDLALALPSDDELNLEWQLGVTETSLGAEPGGDYRIALDNGHDVIADGVVIATGARARPLLGAELV